MKLSIALASSLLVGLLTNGAQAQAVECEVFFDMDFLSPCSEGEYCQLKSGDCLDKIGIFYGTCQVMPDACSMEYNPVCGCDGNSYSNECVAASNGMNIFPGDCHSVGETGGTTPPDAAFVTTAAGQVATDATDAVFSTVSTVASVSTDATNVATVAVTTVAPGSTFAIGSTVGTVTATACELGPEANSSMSCAEGEVCQLIEGECLTEMSKYTGVCYEIPMACTLDWTPVCGCDEMTYANACGAHANGTNVASQGECSQSGGPALPDGQACEVGVGASPDMSCATGEFCQLDEGVCLKEIAFHTGTCQMVPAICTLNEMPVCGCDGMSYANECGAHANGTSVATQGECSTAPEGAPCEVGPDLIFDSSCGDAEYCQLEIGDCPTEDAVMHYGTCEVIPDACTDEYFPVCGCDDITYSNTCAAAASGMSIASEGECLEAQPEGQNCEVGPGADPSMVCGDGEFCLLELGLCLTESEIQAGTCNAIPEFCTLDENPVCGCDGMTYANECGAHAQGISAASLGECASTDDVPLVEGDACEVGSDMDFESSCSEGEYCQLEVGDCRTKTAVHYGTCQVMPEQCTMEYVPVCGCDVNTYASACEAAASGMSLASEEECPAADNATLLEGQACEVGSEANPEMSCLDEEFCQLDEGVCITDSSIYTGTCNSIPAICTLDENPVCGCDGMTYANECGANANGTSVASRGECATAETGSSQEGQACEVGPDMNYTAACGGGEYCQLEIGDCRTKAAVHYGTCQEIPETCTMEYVPVCGCDVNTYANACGAAASGMSIASEGECPATDNATLAEGQACQVGPEADASMACGDGEFCQLDEGACVTESVVYTGTCNEIPEFCTLDMNPVCGCDGMTYSNECGAYANGTSVASQGECSTVEGNASFVECEVGPDMNYTAACSEGEYCRLEVGDCRTKTSVHFGTCQFIPEQCTMEYMPVCGCDVITYANSCEAAANGMSIISEECPDDENVTDDTVFEGQDEENAIDSTELEGQACEVGPDSNPDSCADGEFCLLDVGECLDESAVHTGTCLEVSEVFVCTADLREVCGCDGITYANECSAHGNRTSVASEGPCAQAKDTAPFEVEPTDITEETEGTEGADLTDGTDVTVGSDVTEGADATEESNATEGLDVTEEPDLVSAEGQASQADQDSSSGRMGCIGIHFVAVASVLMAIGTL